MRGENLCPYETQDTCHEDAPEWRTAARNAYCAVWLREVTDGPIPAPGLFHATLESIDMSDLPEHQNAIALDEFGGPERLTLHQISVPEPRDDEVLIRVHTAGIGVWDPSEREGGMAELMDEKPTFPYVLGSDGSGVVARVGDDVDVFSEGDAVWASHFLNPRGGFYSEYVPVK